MIQISNTKHLDNMYYQSGESDLSMMQIDMEPRNIFSSDEEMVQLQKKISDLKVNPSITINPNGDNGLIIYSSQYMDVREPLSTLKSLLEHKLNFSLNGYQFLLHDFQVMEKHKIFVDQCFQSGGFVQINVQINQTQKKINIVDVLKPH